MRQGIAEHSNAVGRLCQKSSQRSIGKFHKIPDVPGHCSVLHTLDLNATTMSSSESFSKDRILDFDSHFGCLCEGRKGVYFLKVCSVGMPQNDKNGKENI